MPYTLALQELEKQQIIELILQTPSECSAMLQSDLVDLALIPVGSLSDFQKLSLISDYGISCQGAVRTVKLFSEFPIQEVEQIILDKSSRSSNLLIQILCKAHWQRSDIIFKFTEDDQLQKKTAYLNIGDKVFELENIYEYEYDLGQEWYKLTGLPFVFAIWVSRRNLDNQFINMLNESFQKSLINFPKNSKSQTQMPFTHFESYFKENIEYKLGKRHFEGLQKFLEFAGISDPLSGKNKI